MYKNKRVAVILAAAGKGKRMGSQLPKQFLEIGGVPILVKTLQVFDNMDEVDYIFVVTNEEYMEHCSEITKKAGIKKISSIVAGGKKRQDSVYNALMEVNLRHPGVEYVLIHDGARPYVSEEVIHNVIEATASKGAAVACVALKNSIRRNGIEGSSSMKRSEFVSVQTPQGFKKAELIRSYEAAMESGYYGTDDAELVERAGYNIELVQGDYQNIKITTKEDLPMENRVGTGYDVHAFASGRKLILGGVEIPFDRGLEGHSDADVLVHAIMDALIGAAGKGDIGRHFPDTDESYKGISSIVLLAKVKGMLDEGLFKIANIDATVIAQKPKIAPFIDEMIQNLATILEMEESRINIKGTTTEKLGFTGREEGIAAQAVCSIYR
ncbi:MAG: 2-C-methyl-D-erythritol 4-phosphate cytidylyltransferase [Bacillota bacterium]|nr:2-C-methyl-D-erythritol 4-phosphate cytidylyltransferase [Bacillota bacterium]